VGVLRVGSTFLFFTSGLLGRNKKNLQIFHSSPQPSSASSICPARGFTFNPFFCFFSAKDAGMLLVCRWLPTAALLRSRELFPQRRASCVPRTNCTQRFPRDLCLLLPGPRHLQDLKRALFYFRPRKFASSGGPLLSGGLLRSFMLRGHGPTSSGASSGRVFFSGCGKVAWIF